MRIEDITIDENKKLLDAVLKLDKASRKILFTVEGKKLKGILTDGDVRRWLLQKGNLDVTVKNVANNDPIYLLEEKRNKAKQIIEENKIVAIPIINGDHEIVEVEFREDLLTFEDNKISVPVVMMAGGYGKRLYPYTKILPKALVPMGEIPISEHIINRFYSYGIENYYLVVNHKKNMIKAYYNEVDRKYKISYVEEDTPLGTGGGLGLLKDQIKTTFFLTNCDILLNENYKNILDFHKKNENLITMVCSLKHQRIPYGVIELDDMGEIVEIKEKPELTFFTNTGVYVVEPEVIKNIKLNEKVDFPDIIEEYRVKGGKIGVYPVSEDSWFDMGEPEGMDQMRVYVEGL